VIALGPAQAIVLAVAALRLGELALARANDRRLRAAGAVEHGAGHYPLFVLLHTAWLTALFLLAPADTAPSLGWLALFATAMALRLSAIASLGRRWSTRVLVLPDAPLVARGPYRWLRHPNYLAVAIELFALGFALNVPLLGLLFGALNLPLLALRIRVEDRALRASPRSMAGVPPAVSTARG